MPQSFRVRSSPLLVGLLAAPLMWAQSAPRLTAAVRAAVIDSAVARLERTYVEADTARLIGRRLRAQLETGGYEGSENPAQFAELVTRDLRSLNGDLHLSLRYVPNPGQSGPAGQPGDDPRLLNFGLGKAEILDGNIGYLEITGFMGAPGYEEAVVDALRFLSRTDAVIIDVRRNGGGSSDMSHFIFSHFLGPEPVPTIRVRRRAPAEPTVRQSLAAVPGPRRPAVPLYVLTSQASGSAAEEFTFVLKNRKRATIVGTRTAGAGHMVAFMPVGNGFVIGLSITRVSDPQTGKEWEQVGVQPDLAVPAESALVEGHAAALRAVLAGTSDPERARVLGRVLAAVEARARPMATDPVRIARFQGRYEGRVVSVTGGRLRYARRDGGLAEDLIPLGGDRFALGATQLLFEIEGASVRLTIEPADGTRISFLRTP